MDAIRWLPAYVGIGSNLENPERQVRRAIAELATVPRSRTIATSRLYLSKPFGPLSQPDFVNAVVGMLTQCELGEFFGALRDLELSLGRAPATRRWGPRSIDLDLLVFGSLRHDEPQLTVPHPGIVERNFVLYPLADVAPEMEVPGLGRVSQLRERVKPDGIALFEESDRGSRA